MKNVLLIVLFSEVGKVNELQITKECYIFKI